MSFITQIDTSTLTNQNITSALLVHTFTNTSRVRKIKVAVDADQIAGNGTYVVRAKVQRAGAGSEFSVGADGSVVVASGVTSVSFDSTEIVLNATDVLKVYLVGLAGDTTTPDITTRVWEENALAPLEATTIATIATQLSFTLTAGSADDDAYNLCFAIIEDATTAVQKAVVFISDYVGATKTVTLLSAPKFTVAVGDRITIVAQESSGTTVGGVSGGGTGARTVTVTVQTSGAAAIQGALVRMTKGAESFTQTTNASGQCQFNLNDGTWTVAITAVGYSFAGTTLVVDGTETPTYTMTTNSVTAPAAPNLSVGTLLCLGTDGLPEPNVVITFRMTVGPGSAGYSLDSAEFEATSDAQGEIEVPHVQLAQYAARRGTVGREVSYTVPATASFTLPEQLGAP